MQLTAITGALKDGDLAGAVNRMVPIPAIKLIVNAGQILEDRKLDQGDVTNQLMVALVQSVVKTFYRDDGLTLVHRDQLKMPITSSNPEYQSAIKQVCQFLYEAESVLVQDHGSLQDCSNASEMMATLSDCLQHLPEEDTSNDVSESYDEPVETINPFKQQGARYG
jgi:hypothetical protein